MSEPGQSPRAAGQVADAAIVAFGAGMAVYAALWQEPTPRMAALWAAAGAVSLVWLGWKRAATPVPVLLVLAVVCGLGLGALKTVRIATPVIERDWYGPVAGRIVALDRSAGGHPRVLLEDVTLFGWAGPPLERVRIVMRGDLPDRPLLPGQGLLMEAGLAAPKGPVEPGGFDFRRYSYFRQIGATGFAPLPVLRYPPADARGWRTWIEVRRVSLSRALRSRMDGRSGGFAAAILTGDRSELDPADVAHLRAANLAHLLAISGLHVGMLTGLVFALARLALLMLPSVGDRWPVRKIAALAALAAGIAYLGLSGGNVATQRAFVMVAIMLGAVMLDRPALTIRSVTIAALVLLCLGPAGTVLEAGFQMSFSATLALVAAFGAVRGRFGPAKGWAALATRWLAALALSALVAGAATAPFAAYHFNLAPRYGLVANMLAVPVMGSVIMPGAIAAACLAPIGLAAPALWVMGKGIALVLAIAATVASWPGAVAAVPAGPPMALALVTAGGLWVCLAARRNWGGLPVAAAGIALWLLTPRPDLIVAPSGRVAGLLTEAGRSLSDARGDRFAVENWLAADGDTADLKAAAERPGWTRDGGLRLARSGAWTIVLMREGEGFEPVCRAQHLLILPGPAPQNGPCVAIGRSDLDQRGAVAVYFRGSNKRPDLRWTDPAQRVRPWAGGPSVLQSGQ
ncbi:ComEC/Rec2 family competence protein [Oceanomicrobium pacificus]|uniref:DUF4131 domain-containing protein n=1 Tax=Oceanomicrobium pacificus TaxID=2692916 RepID=A0A6B0U4F5_9RHOB|nr:ComEC/Rec2 family competence protein [Oceanomicrobium pacificus]MXU65821.1 DUF4131 domain-containing protein [Oceanomicrobium pacificus]